MSSEDVQEAARQHKMRQYVMDPTFSQPYLMDRVKFEKKIKVNLVQLLCKLIISLVIVKN